MAFPITTMTDDDFLKHRRAVEEEYYRRKSFYQEKYDAFSRDDMKDLIERETERMSKLALKGAKVVSYWKRYNFKDSQDEVDLTALDDSLASEDDPIYLQDYPDSVAYKTRTIRLVMKPGKYWTVVSLREKLRSRYEYHVSAVSEEYDESGTRGAFLVRYGLHQHFGDILWDLRAWGEVRTAMPCPKKLMTRRELDEELEDYMALHPGKTTSEN